MANLIGLSSGAEMNAFRKLILLLIAIFGIGCEPALAEKRIALVIGNSAYKNVPRLTNPANDAALVAEMFRTARFDEVTTRINVNASDMRKTLREFGARARDVDIAVIYYAGHGIELDGNNYLIPTDAVLEADADVLDETVPLDRLLFAVEPAKQLRLIILDACRDNPFAKTMKRTIASRAVGRGLAKVEPNTPNTMIAFAAKAGSTASDGDSKNSPFATALVDHLPKPGLDLRKAFGFVRDDVLKNTGYKQEPYVYGSLGGDDVPLVPAKAVAMPQPNPDDATRRDYELALQLGTRDGWSAFLARYPNGFYADLARGQLNKIAAEEARAAAAEKARLAEQEMARLAAEGAKKAEQAKAAAEAKAAEEARVVAEKTQQIERAKAEAAERVRVAAEQATAERLAAERAAAEKTAADLAPERAAEKPAVEPVAQQKDEIRKLALLPPHPDAVAISPSGVDLAKSLQLELRRVGCFTGSSADGSWNVGSRRSLTLFNKYAGTNLDVKVASVDALDATKATPSRVCPLLCEHGFRADGDRCVRITCPTGYRANGDNECKKIQQKTPAATREEAPKREQPERAITDTQSTKPLSPPNAACDRHFQRCVNIRARIDGPYGSCEQRLTICRRTGNWTDRFGQVHQTR
jgi:uncharacterized caspase-like protein